MVQACLSWWSTVSPFGGTGSTAALSFVVIVAGVKAVWEDSKRHKEDWRTNASTAHVLRNNGAPACSSCSIHTWLTGMHTAAHAVQNAKPFLTPSSDCICTSALHVILHCGDAWDSILLG